MDKPKNPRRINSQLRSRLRNARRAVYWQAVIVSVAVLIVAASFFIRVPKWVVVASVIVFVSVGIGLLESIFDMHAAQEKFVPEDSEPDEPS